MMDWIPALITSIPLLLLLVILHLTNRRKLRETNALVLQLREQQERRERELASVERQLAGAAEERTKLGRAQVVMRKQLEEALVGIEERLAKQAERPIEPISEPKSPAPAAEPAAETGPRLSDSPLVTEVLELLKSGQSAEETARIKGIQVGEVTLIQRLTSFAPRAKEQPRP